MTGRVTPESIATSRERIETSIDKPSVARIYDYLLGGSHNYAVDRDFAERQLEVWPGIRAAMQANRRFLGRATRYAVESGIRQFVDIGSGLPSDGQVHEVAEEVLPDVTKVVYVDNEPIAHAHAQILLGEHADPDRHFALDADLLDYRKLWRQVSAIDGIDAEQPICLLVVALLHFIPDDKGPHEALAHLRDQLAPGSMLVISHGADVTDEAVAEVVRNYNARSTSTVLRTPEQITEFFGDFELADPGLTWVPRWRPDERETFAGPPAESVYLGGVARKSG
ncbi:SAM-dependent methyltransferase [Amycolatopsis nigrescens]|uniref:SAM-dependent methyltransferase n=1 Tax=Amycolatopsis nigrescens TaxID=381445 RepID=UPI00035DC961|nr:SAM-dependent methyltransferase [Amycolatopsis nigrescens]